MSDAEGKYTGTGCSTGTCGSKLENALTHTTGRSCNSAEAPSACEEGMTHDVVHAGTDNDMDVETDGDAFAVAVAGAVAVDEELPAYFDDMVSTRSKDCSSVLLQYAL